MPFCSKCGTEVAEGINFCGKCGNALGSGQSTNPNPAPTQTNYTASGGGGGTPFVLEKQFLVGLVAIVLGIVGVVYSWITISSDMAGNGFISYSYEAPLTNHEITMIVVLIVSIIVSIVGGIILGLSKKGKLGGDVEASVKSGSSSFVSNDVSVKSGSRICPNCKKPTEASSNICSHCYCTIT